MNIKLCIFKKFIAIFSASLIFINAFAPINAIDDKTIANNSTMEKNNVDPTENNINAAENNANLVINNELNKDDSSFHISNINLNNDKILMSKKVIDDSCILFEDSPDQKCFLGQKRKNDSLAIDLMVANWPAAKKKKFDICGVEGDSKISNPSELVNVCLQKNKNDIKDVLKIFCDVSQLRSAINSYLNSKNGSDASKKNCVLVSDCLKKLTLTFETATIFNISQQVEAAHIILLELKKIKNDENLTNDPNYKLIFTAARSNLYEYISKKLEHIFGPALDKNECANYANDIINCILDNSEYLDNIFDYAYNNSKSLNMLNYSIVSYFENLFYKKLQTVQNKKDAICKEMDYICALISQLKSALDEDVLLEESPSDEKLKTKLMSLLNKNVVYLTEMITGCNCQKMISCKLNTLYGGKHYIYSLSSFNADYERYRSGSGDCKLELFKLLTSDDENDDYFNFKLDECIIFDPLVDDYESKKDLRGGKFFVLPPQRVDKFNKNSEPDLNEKKKILNLIHKSLEKIYFPPSNEKYNANISLDSTSFKDCLEEILSQINNMKKLYQ